MLVVVVIGVILLVTLVKPVLKKAGESAVAGGQEAGAYAAVGSYFLMKAKHR